MGLIHMNDFMKCGYVFSEADKDMLLGMGYVLLWSDPINGTYIFAIDSEAAEKQIAELNIPIAVSGTLLF